MGEVELRLEQQSRTMHNSRDGVGTSPRTGEGRTMQEQLSRVKQEARTEEQLSVNPNIALPLNVGHRASDAQSTRSFLK